MTTSRREFLAVSAAAVAAAPSLYAAGNDVLKVGLIGCGARGTGAAGQALQADKNVKLVAMADAFEDRLEESLANLLKKKDVAEKIDVKPDTKFTGFDAYKHVIERCDVVLLCTPPQFRPLHLKAAVEAGKHVFAEKPVAVDGPGVRSVLQSCAEAKKKNLSVVSGLCLRFDSGFQETVKRIHGGAIGDVVTLFANDYRGGRWEKKRQPTWSDMTYHMRNWYNFTWLSGDFNVEQHVHFLDVCSWVLGEKYPTKAIGMGGRTVLSGQEYGNIYDHFSIVYEYANGSRLVSNTRQHPKTKGDMSARAIGTRGQSLLSERTNGLTIKSDKDDWVYEGPANEMYQAEHDALFASIRNGKPINNGEYMSHSTLLAIMGRMAAYTGQEITWKMALDSKEDLFKGVLGTKNDADMPKYDWDTKLLHPPVSLPGIAKYVWFPEDTVTEAEWLACDDPEDMILEMSFPPHEVTERKLRLFVCACCRLIWHNMIDPRSHKAVEVAERFTDDLASVDELRDASTEAGAAYRSEHRIDRTAAELVEYLAALSASSVARIEDGWPFWEHARDVSGWAIEIGRNQTFGPNEEATRVEVTEFLRDIFGNPFRPVTFEPVWRTSDVILLARGIYDERAFDRMPILADALQDAGCDNTDILSHLRDANAMHVRGCWALDLVLGKE